MSENNSEIQALKEQVKALTTQLNRLKSDNLPSRSPQYQPLTPNRYQKETPYGRSWSSQKPRMFCPYCRSHTHNLRECTLAPHDGSCFDCGRLNCRRENRNCSERANQNSS